MGGGERVNQSIDRIRRRNRLLKFPWECERREPLIGTLPQEVAKGNGERAFNWGNNRKGQTEGSSNQDNPREPSLISQREIIVSVPNHDAR